jgi:hypothetical protein
MISLRVRLLELGFFNNSNAKIFPVYSIESDIKTVQPPRGFPEITDVVIENDNIVSLTQGYYDIDKVTVHIQECIEMVRKYEKMGYCGSEFRVG